MLAEAIATKPTLIRSVIRADRYAATIATRDPIVAHAGQPFFWGIEYADDLVEWWVEQLRPDASKPPQSVGPMSAEEWEVISLEELQMACGVCDRLDLVDRSTVKNWRDRFSVLDRWFQANRPFIVWDEARSCIRIDQEAKQNAAPTGRKSRRIPELKPPWPTPMAEPK